MADARDAASYLEIVAANGGELRAAAAYIETAGQGLNVIRESAYYAEVTATASGEMRLARTYVEVLAPAKPQFIGWGVQVGGL